MRDHGAFAERIKQRYSSKLRRGLYGTITTNTISLLSILFCCGIALLQISNFSFRELIITWLPVILAGFLLLGTLLGLALSRVAEARLVPALVPQIAHKLTKYGLLVQLADSEQLIKPYIASPGYAKLSLGVNKSAERRQLIDRLEILIDHYPSLCQRLNIKPWNRQTETIRERSGIVMSVSVLLLLVIIIIGYGELNSPCNGGQPSPALMTVLITAGLLCLLTWTALILASVAFNAAQKLAVSLAIVECLELDEGAAWANQAP
ncbi:hypothetical protein JW859_01095 [bacterium]|nr:hypothetical protein [bacterium]